MSKIAFMGAGSTVFAKNVLGDCLLSPILRGSEISLYDIDAERLEDSRLMLENLNRNINEGRARITAHLGVDGRKDALHGADFVVNAIHVGGYQPSTVIDFEIPRKYGLRQTIADTLGVGGIFRSLRTIPVVLDFARDMEEVCPHALFLNYVNPMAMITGALLRGSSIKTVGLCHSVQTCASSLMGHAGLTDEIPMDEVQWKIAGINHMAWLLEISHSGEDLYPRIKRIVGGEMDRLRAEGVSNALKRLKDASAEDKDAQREKHILNDLVRLEVMMRFGHYITESSEHNAEYMPYWIKARHPELIEEFNIPLDEYPRRCVNQIAGWKRQREEIVSNTSLTHSRTHEYGSYIMEAIITGKPYTIGGNVLNNGILPDLPDEACVEVPCLVDRNGVQPTRVGALPPQLAALNRTNINVQLLTVEAALTGKKEHIYHAAMLDPHTAAEMRIDDIVKMCDELIKAHGEMLPKFR